ncbi:hypothetical protein EMIT036CA2_60062 [Chryseobacterium sp. IT-36CA2]
MPEKVIKKKSRINNGIEYGCLRIVNVPDKQYNPGWDIKKQNFKNKALF